MEIWELKQKQSLPLEAKVKLSLDRIRQWYEYWDGNVYVAFSGGKDSTVLLNLARSLYPEITAVFNNTGLEYPEIIKFVKTIKNVVWLIPKMPFKEVIEKYGYPIISKEISHKIYVFRNTKSEKYRNRILYGNKNGNYKISIKWRYLISAPFIISDKCCDILKKNPAKLYEKETKNKPYLGMMANDSRGRQMVYLNNNGCNAFESKRPKSNPLSVWLEKDIWEYIKKYNIPYSEIYNMGYKNTGCVFCIFGVHLEKEPNKFQLMKDTHPKLYDYCMNKLGCGKVLNYIGVKTYKNKNLF